MLVSHSLFCLVITLYETWANKGTGGFRVLPISHKFQASLVLALKADLATRARRLRLMALLISIWTISSKLHSLSRQPTLTPLSGEVGCLALVGSPVEGGP